MNGTTTTQIPSSIPRRNVSTSKPDFDGGVALVVVLGDADDVSGDTDDDSVDEGDDDVGTDVGVVGAVEVAVDVALVVLVVGVVGLGVCVELDVVDVVLLLVVSAEAAHSTKPAEKHS